MEEETKKLIYILTKAIDLEREGYKAFKKAAEKVKNSKAKELFLRLAKAETRHEEVLLEEYDALVKGENIPSGFEAMEDQAPEWAKRIGGFCCLKIEEDTGDLEIINMAIKAEADACRFFTRMAAFRNNPKEKDLYIKLGEEENKHKILLEAEYQQLISSGYFFDSQEFSVEF